MCLCLCVRECPPRPAEGDRFPGCCVGGEFYAGRCAGVGWGGRGSAVQCLEGTCSLGLCPVEDLGL